MSEPPPPPPPLPPLKPSQQHSYTANPQLHKPQTSLNQDSFPFEPTTYSYQSFHARPHSQPIIPTDPPSGDAHRLRLVILGPYRALVPSSPSSVVSGFAYKVQSREGEVALAKYETNAYEAVPYLIQLAPTDGQTAIEVTGKTFVYAGDPRALERGTFDRKLWERQMGVSLPAAWKSDRSWDHHCAAD